MARPITPPSPCRPGQTRGGCGNLASIRPGVRERGRPPNCHPNAPAQGERRLQPFAGTRSGARLTRLDHAHCCEAPLFKAFVKGRPGGSHVAMSGLLHLDPAPAAWRGSNGDRGAKRNRAPRERTLPRVDRGLNPGARRERRYIALARRLAPRAPPFFQKPAALAGIAGPSTRRRSTRTRRPSTQTLRTPAGEIANIDGRPGISRQMPSTPARRRCARDRDAHLARGGQELRPADGESRPRLPEGVKMTRGLVAQRRRTVHLGSCASDSKNPAPQGTGPLLGIQVAHPARTPARPPGAAAAKRGRSRVLACEPVESEAASARDPGRIRGSSEEDWLVCGASPPSPCRAGLGGAHAEKAATAKVSSIHVGGEKRSARARPRRDWRLLGDGLWGATGKSAQRGSWIERWSMKAAAPKAMVKREALLRSRAGWTARKEMVSEARTSGIGVRDSPSSSSSQVATRVEGTGWPAGRHGADGHDERVEPRCHGPGYRDTESGRRASGHSWPRQKADSGVFRNAGASVEESPLTGTLYFLTSGKGTSSKSPLPRP